MDDKIRWAVSRALMWPGIGLMLLGFGAFGLQAANWLMEASWPPLPTSVLWTELFGYPRFEWRGVQKIVNWLLNVPLSVGAACIGYALYYIGGLIDLTRST